jgi:hypothetical protein
MTTFLGAHFAAILYAASEGLAAGIGFAKKNFVSS